MVSDILKVAAGVGLVGAGVIGVNMINSGKKRLEALADSEHPEDDGIYDAEFRELKPAETLILDRDKLSKILVDASFPKKEINDFMEKIKAEATTTVNCGNPKAEKAIKFSKVTEEEKKIPNFTKKNDIKKEED